MNGETPDTSSPEPREGAEERTRILKPPADGGWITPPPENWASSWASEPAVKDGAAPAEEAPARSEAPARNEQADTAVYPGRDAIRPGHEALRPPEPFQAPEPEWLSERHIEAPRKKKGYFRRFFRDIVFPLGVAFGIAMFAQATIAKPYQIPSGSMLPTIQLQDRILANRLVYRFFPIERGDVVVFTPPASVDQNTPYVKRVIGLPGDVVEVRSGDVLVNGQELEVPAATIPSYTKIQEKVPEGMLFVLGDNRNESSDSHIWGFVPADNVIGKAQVIYWPPGHFQWIGN